MQILSRILRLRIDLALSIKALIVDPVQKETC